MVSDRVDIRLSTGHFIDRARSTPEISSRHARVCRYERTTSQQQLSGLILGDALVFRSAEYELSLIDFLRETMGSLVVRTWTSQGCFASEYASYSFGPQSTIHPEASVLLSSTGEIDYRYGS
jgi:hypothetical protein